MLSRELEFTINEGFRRAREKGHEFITVEQIQRCDAMMDRLLEKLKAGH